MPTYNYECQDCQSEFDIMATIEEKIANSSNQFLCSNCRSTKIKQIFSLTSLVKKADSKCDGDCAPGGGCCG